MHRLFVPKVSSGPIVSGPSVNPQHVGSMSASHLETTFPSRPVRQRVHLRTPSPQRPTTDAGVAWQRVPDPWHAPVTQGSGTDLQPMPPDGPMAYQQCLAWHAEANAWLPATLRQIYPFPDGDYLLRYQYLATETSRVWLAPSQRHRLVPIGPPTWNRLHSRSPRPRTRGSHRSRCPARFAQTQRACSGHRQRAINAGHGTMPVREKSS